MVHIGWLIRLDMKSPWHFVRWLSSRDDSPTWLWKGLIQWPFNSCEVVNRNKHSGVAKNSQAAWISKLLVFGHIRTGGDCDTWSVQTYFISSRRLMKTINKCSQRLIFETYVFKASFLLIFTRFPNNFVTVNIGGALPLHCMGILA